MEIEKWNKQDNIFDGYLEKIYLDLDRCDVFFIRDKGYAVLNHAPKYAFYKRLGIAEIQDIFTLPNMRGQGVATALIAHCEAQVEGDMVGISVPVSPQFGVAQQLYFKLGYAPDGNGVTYDREMLRHGQMVKCDDDLCMMLVKNLNLNQR